MRLSGSLDKSASDLFAELLPAEPVPLDGLTKLTIGRVLGADWLKQSGACSVAAIALAACALVRAERLTACRHAIAHDTIAPSGTALVDW